MLFIHSLTRFIFRVRILPLRLQGDTEYWTIIRFLLPEHFRKFFLQLAIDRINVTSVKIEYLVPYLIFQAIEQNNETGLERLI